MFFPFVTAALVSTPRETLLNTSWAFHRQAPGLSSADPYEGPDWENVNLPHTAKLIDELDTRAQSFQGIVWYRKTIEPKPAFRGKNLAIRFDGAMQVADVWVNGTARAHHEGGYLPFEVDLSPELSNGKAAQIEVKLDNRDHPEFNPGRSQRELDFTYAGGLYRDVWLEVTNSKARLGDVYGTGIDVTPKSASIYLQDKVEGGHGTVEAYLYDPNGRFVSRIPCPSGMATFRLKKPMLWDLDHPNLYRVAFKLEHHGVVIDQRTVRFGIRSLKLGKDGLLLNGKPIKLEGSNRHMAFPVIGNAASDAAQYREAKLLKSLGLNILRLAHYPQSPDFLDACDELGLLVIDPIPGWQFFRNTPTFKDHVLSDVRETVRRDRNHPCVAIFETCLNETYNAPDEFWRTCSRTAHDEFYPGNFFTGGDSYGKQDYSHPIWDIPWTGWDDANFTRPALFKMQKGVDREYGDYEFGGEQSTSRADWTDGEGALLLQAWNFIWSHNRNRGNPWSLGDLTWEAIDTRRGMSNSSPISKSGMLDLYRYPKPVAAFYQSQGLKAPYVHIANEWTNRPSPTKVIVFSNCDKVSLFLNGRKIRTQAPDSGPTTGYLGPKVADPLYWAHGKGDIVPATSLQAPVGGKIGALPFSGGNCRNLKHPPFTFDRVPYRSGELQAVGYLHGKAVVRDHVFTPGKPDHIVLEVATEGRPLEADGSDFVFVYAKICDRNGQVVPSYNAPIHLKVIGAATALPGAVRPAIAGIAPFMVQAKTVSGPVRLVATSGSLASHISLQTVRGNVRP